MKVTEDHMVSLQLGTSKPDVYIKLQVRHATGTLLLYFNLLSVRLAISSFP